MRRGFTLVELITVLAIVGVAAAAVAPAMASLRQKDAALSPVRGLDSLLRTTRQTALEESRMMRLTIDPESGRYWVDDRGAEGHAVDLQGAMIETTEPRLHVTFHPDGHVDADSFVVRTGAGVFFISLERWLGDVRVRAR